MQSAGTENSAPDVQTSEPVGVGLLGGTFNPIHNGHLEIARQTRDALHLKRIVFIPTGDPPHKPQENLAPARDRYEMVRLAVASDPSFTVSDIEVRRPGKSYSIDTIRLLLEQYGGSVPLYFLIGLDAFLELPTWRDPAIALTLCSFVVISRPGAFFQALGSLPLIPRIPRQSLVDLDEGSSSRLEVPIGEQALICLRLPPCEVSASDIRTRIKQGRPTANLLPPAVDSYILQHHIYS
ncbi:MAG TPA: nicotinate-nucleotide adenylyltransferase [Nitrospira sp.]|nr:nicotinate-nucleotide adenylyltransferase [Nitrospira sp.]